MTQTQTDPSAGAADEDGEDSLYTRSIVIVPRQQVVPAIGCPFCFSVREDELADDVCFVESTSRKACCPDCVERVLRRLIEDVGVCGALGAICEPLLAHMKSLARRPAIDPIDLQQIVSDQTASLEQWANVGAPAVIQAEAKKIERRLKENKQ